jgi:hypothetical protein
MKGYDLVRGTGQDWRAGRPTFCVALVANILIATAGAGSGKRVHVADSIGIVEVGTLNAELLSSASRVLRDVYLFTYDSIPVVYGKIAVSRGWIS